MCLCLNLLLLDRGYGTCEIDWAKANYSTVYKSYIVSILIFCFFIPVLVMLFTYVSIINTVKRGNAMAAEGDLTERQRKIERDVTIVSRIQIKSTFIGHVQKICRCYQQVQRNAYVTSSKSAVECPTNGLPRGAVVLHRSASCATRDPGSSPGSVAAGRDHETHNWPGGAQLAQRRLG